MSILNILISTVWVETTPQDFADGWYDPLLYVSRRLQIEGINPSDSGAVEFYARFDANRDGFYDLTSAGLYGPVRIWWGNSTGYSASNRRDFPTSSGGNCDIADLNLDGWPELIHSGYASYCLIYWGSQASGGPNPTMYTSLPANLSEAVFAYDLDKDTYLDIILEEENVGTVRVYWGSRTGYSPVNFSSRALSARGHNIEVADLNKDGYPDIVLPRRVGWTWGITILWGDGTPRNLSDNPIWYEDMSGTESHGLTIADFNKDGWLDILVSGWFGIGSSKLYFSQSGSFSSANSVVINPGESYGGSSAWDFNGDGWLDLVFFRGRTSAYPLLIYRNSGTPPYFRDIDTVRIGIAKRYTGGFIYDFNNDGKADVFANDWDGNSCVYWGIKLTTGSYDSVQILPISYDHHGGFRECGNIYDRSPTAWYESSIFSNTNLQRDAQIRWIAWDSIQIGSEIRMYIRTRPDTISPWTSWRQVTNGELVSEPPYFPAKEIQYRAEFEWRNPSWLPWLERVQISTQPLYDECNESPERQSYGVICLAEPGGIKFQSEIEAELILWSADGRIIISSLLRKGETAIPLKSGVYFWRAGSYRGKAVVK
ncbi:MAG: VCBS repeat-containing protein [candidate division WOR-3 bacterium]